MFYSTLTSLPTLSSIRRRDLTAYIAPLCKLGKRTFPGRCNPTGNISVEGEPLEEDRGASSGETPGLLSSDLISSPTHPWAGTSVQHPNHITCVATEFLPFPYFSVMSPQASILLLPASCLPPPSPPICFTQGVPARLPPLHLSLFTSQPLSKMSSSTSLGYSASLFPTHTMC